MPRTIYVYRAVFPGENDSRETFEIADGKHVIAAGITVNLINDIEYLNPKHDELRVIPRVRPGMNLTPGNGSILLGLTREQIKKLADRDFEIEEASASEMIFGDYLMRND